MSQPTQAAFVTTYEMQRYFGTLDFKKKGYTGKDIPIIIVDTGVRKQHKSFIRPDGTNAVVMEKHFIASNVDKTPQDHAGHGTATASIAAGSHWEKIIGDNKYIFEGVAPDALIVNAKALSAYGSGQLLGLSYAMEWGAKVAAELNPKIQIMSCSWGMPGAYHGANNHNTIQSILAKYPNLIIFFAQGNSDRIGEKNGRGSTSCPADDRDVIAVGGVACLAPRLDAHAAFSSVGPAYADSGLKKPDVCGPSGNMQAPDWWVDSQEEFIRVPWISSQTAPAPGVIESAINYARGTSFSCPFEAGTCAVLAEKYPNHDRAWYKEKVFALTRAVPNP